MDRIFDKISLDNMTPSMLINEIAKMFDEKISDELKSFGISGGYRRMFFQLAHEDGLTQLDLVKRTNLTAPTVSVSLKKMESEGLVVRRTDDRDLRQVRVYLTDKGRKFDDLIREASKKKEDEMHGGISDNEWEALRQTLVKVFKNML